MNVFFAELERLRSRRLLKVLLLLVSLGFLIAGMFRLAGISSVHLENEIATAEEVSGLLVLVFVIVGATAIGAEWPNRSITGSLTYEPRRGRLLAAKLAAAILIAFVGAIFLELVLLLFTLPAVFVDGSTQGVDASWWLDYAGALARAGFVCAFGATFGLAIGTIGRNSGAALGVAFLYFAVLESLLRVWEPDIAELLIGDNMGIVATGETTGFGYERSGVTAAVTLVVYGALLFGTALVFFRRRDIA